MIEATAKEIASEHQRTRRRARISSTDIVSQPVRVQLSRRKGARLGKNTISVARPSKWGNPFKVTPERSQILAVGAFQTWLTAEGVTAGIADRKQWMIDNLKELRGKNLACWCKIIDEAGNYVQCHADILLAVANGMTQDEVRNENLKAHEGRQK